MLTEVFINVLWLLCYVTFGGAGVMAMSRRSQMSSCNEKAEAAALWSRCASWHHSVQRRKEYKEARQSQFSSLGFSRTSVLLEGTVPPRSS